MMYLRPLMEAITYTWAQDNADTPVTLYFLKTKAIYLPFFMLVLELLLGGQQAFFISATGYIAGHLYLFLDKLYPSRGGARLISTPSFLYRLFPGNVAGSGGNSRFTQTSFGSFARPVAGGPRGSGTGAGAGTGTSSTGSQPSAYSRFSFSSPFQGKGQRLGG